MSTLQTTPLYALHRALGARLVAFAGVQMPLQYEGVLKEHHAVRNAAGLFDVSHMGELNLRGAEALAVLNGVVTSELADLRTGEAKYTLACNEAGGILDDVIVYRLDADDWLLVCNASNRQKIATHVGAMAASRCAFEDVSDDTALIALQGPKSFEILDAVPSLRRCDGGPWGTTRSFSIHPVQDHRSQLRERTWVARTGYTGELGVEIFCPNADAEALFSQLLEVGKADGAVPAGLAARDTLRLEAALSLYGHELTEETTPFQAGLGKLVHLQKPQFVGRTALSRRAAEPAETQLVGFEVVGRGTARAGYPVFAAGESVGEVTSGSVAPTLGKSVGLAYVRRAEAQLGTELEVELPRRDRTMAVKVVPTPFYRRPKAGPGA